MPKCKLRSFILVVIGIALPLRALAWGGRGHHIICEAATYLVKNAELRHFLTARPQVMGHVCNIPDIYWRSLGSEINSLGAPTHFINVEVTGLKIQDVPANYLEIIAKYEGQQNHAKPGAKIISLPSELGSLWWRADQFFRRAVASGTLINSAKPPHNRHEEQDDHLPYNQSVYDMMVNMALMGHFVGDASQPFHATFDYDGYGSGHGGVHTYYEDQAVNAQDVDLVVQVERAAAKLKGQAAAKNRFLTASNPVEKMRALSLISAAEIAPLLAIDPTTSPSRLEKTNKTPAKRRPVETVAAQFAPFIVAELARSAALLSTLWDEAYEKAGKPELSSYHAYRYPLTPEFVPPDYLGILKNK